MLKKIIAPVWISGFALLLCSCSSFMDRQDYATDIQGAVEAPAFNMCLLYCENAKNVKITGAGTINGRGKDATFKGLKTKRRDRPMLIRFVNCKGVTFAGITLLDASSWCTHMVNCDDLVFKDVHGFTSDDL